MLMVGFRLPAGTPVFATMNGRVARAAIAQPSMFRGFIARVYDPCSAPTDPASPRASYRGILQLETMQNTEIRAGDIVGRVGDPGANSFNDYNFLFQIAPTEMLQEFFPSIGSQSIKTIPHSGPLNPARTPLELFVQRC